MHRRSTSITRGRTGVRAESGSDLIPFLTSVPSDNFVLANGENTAHVSDEARLSRADQGASIRDGETPTPRVLWIDDNADWTYVRLLEFQGVKADCALTGGDGLTRARSQAYDAYVIDLQLPDMYGLTVLERLRADGTEVPALVLTGCYTEFESEKLARRLGAADFCCKPVFADELARRLKSVLARRAIAPAERDRDEGRAAAAASPEQRFGIVAASAAMREVLDWIDRIGPATMPVLISGDTGTGKELVARALHERSTRRLQAFVPIHCGAFPEGLLESELFGHRRGAFTGAVQDKTGLLEQAAKGTVFLDEIGDMALSAQSRLLRFLEDGELRRVGDSRSRRIDVRVISATNRSLVEECARGHFRSDLYFRLAGAKRHLLPLRERPEDINALAWYFLEQAATTAGKPVVAFDPDALELLETYGWPGNVRELRHAIHYAVAVTDGHEVSTQALKDGLASAPEVPDPLSESLTRPDRGGVPVGGASLGLGQVIRDFWTELHRPFLERDLNRQQVLRAVSQALREERGSYLRMLTKWGVARRDYLKAMDFLRHHRLKPRPPKSEGPKSS